MGSGDIGWKIRCDLITPHLCAPALTALLPAACRLLHPRASPRAYRHVFGGCGTVGGGGGGLVCVCVMDPLDNI